jgi:hypothetical protein
VKRQDSVRRHRLWQQGLDKDEFFGRVMVSSPVNGDYTKERHRLLGDLTVDDVLAKIRRRRRKVSP